MIESSARTESDSSTASTTISTSIIAASSIQGEPRIDSRTFAQRLSLKHQSIIELIAKYVAQFSELGNFQFQTEASLPNSNGAVHDVKFTLLNEDQSYFLLTLNRNTVKVISFKLELVKAFSAARAALFTAPTFPILSHLEILAQMARGLADSEQLILQSIDLVNGAISKNIVLEQRLDNMPMDSEKRGQVHRLGQELARLMGRQYSTTWRMFNNRFGLAAYSSLPNSKFEEAKEFLHSQIAAFTELANLANLANSVNSLEVASASA